MTFFLLINIIFFVKEEWYFKGSGKVPAGGRLENRLKYLRRIADKGRKPNKAEGGSPQEKASCSSEKPTLSSQMKYGMYKNVVNYVRTKVKQA